MPRTRRDVTPQNGDGDRRVTRPTRGSPLPLSPIHEALPDMELSPLAPGSKAAGKKPMYPTPTPHQQTSREPLEPYAITGEVAEVNHKLDQLLDALSQSRHRSSASKRGSECKEPSVHRSITATHRSNQRPTAGGPTRRHRPEEPSYSRTESSRAPIPQHRQAAPSQGRSVHDRIAPPRAY